MSESFEVLPLEGKTSEIDLAVYVEFLRHGRVCPTVLADTLGVQEQDVLASRERLLAVGLLAGGDDDPTGGLALDPQAVIAHLAGSLEERIRRDQQQIIKIGHELERFAARYRTHRAEASDAFELVDSVQEVRAALNRVAEETSEEMISCQPRGGGRRPEAMQEALRRDTRLLQRGVSIRTIYQHAARFNGPSQAYVAMISPMGAQYRTVHQTFGQLIAFDRKTAFIPIMGDSGGAVIVREPSTVAFMSEFFEQTWERATPFADAASQGLERVSHEIRDTIIQLLAAGLKDETIARRLGMSIRTVRRHIADIMDELNVSSRFQAGAVAAAFGLLESPRQD